MRKFQLNVVHAPGLHKQTGAWAYTTGVRNPKVVMDPLAEVQLGGNGLLIHEATHCYMRDALRGIVWLILCPPLYLLHRRRAERRADREVARCCGTLELRAFVYMQRHPTSIWGRWVYSRSAETRIKRALEDR